MKTTIEEILKTYNPHSVEETKAALREIIQSIVLVGLSRGGFFEKAAFYGGTSLRIFHGLNRYSEDLDFTLNTSDDNFTLDNYKDSIIETAKSYGLILEITSKEKKVITPVESAFAKLNTYQTFLNLKIDSKITNFIHKDEVLKVKFEVDCHPSTGFNTETKWLDMPEFAPVVVLDEPSLFAGKLHAVLCRSYKNKVKGRDYYDFLFYVQKGIKPNMQYLKNKLVESGKLSTNDVFDINILKSMLKTRFETLDFDQIKVDANRFVFKSENLSYYSKELFMQMVDKL